MQKNRAALNGPHCSYPGGLSRCYSNSLRPLDVEFMRRLSKVVNIVPVIAKADTLTLEERDDFKQTVSCAPKKSNDLFA